MNGLNHHCLQALLFIAIRIYNSFDNNFEIEKYFTKYLKMSARFYQNCQDVLAALSSQTVTSWFKFCKAICQ